MKADSWRVMPWLAAWCCTEAHLNQLGCDFQRICAVGCKVPHVTGGCIRQPVAVQLEVAREPLREVGHQQVQKLPVSTASLHPTLGLNVVAKQHISTSLVHVHETIGEHEVCSISALLPLPGQPSFNAKQSYFWHSLAQHGIAVLG